MLKEVLIEPSCTAKRAEKFINECLMQYQNEDTRMEFELILENATQFGSQGYVYYTVIIELYSRDM